MRISLIILFLFAGNFYCTAQLVQGFVINKESKLRLAKVYIYNETTDVGVINNGRGEFSIAAKSGDVLYAALEGYALDTLIYKGQSAVYFQLTPLTIKIDQVDIYSTKITPQDAYQQKIKEYKFATDKGSSKDLLNLGLGGVGLGIDAIYNLLSRQGKNGRHLQKILERDYKESIIDYKYKPDLVAKILRISDPELTDFMQQYRPTYSFILESSDYTLNLFIKNSYASYKRNPTAYRLPPLPKIESKP